LSRRHVLPADPLLASLRVRHRTLLWKVGHWK
jgi:hypothetical protein